MSSIVRPDVTVVAAVFNDSARLPELCARVRKAFGAASCQIILVDDRSSDESYAVMQRLDVIALQMAEKAGQNAAILEGLRHATGSRCCVLDADLEDPPEALPRLVEALNDGQTRVAFSTRDGRRKLSSRLFRSVMRQIYPTLPRRACLCFAMDCAAVAAVVDAASPGDYLVAVIGALKLPARQVAIAREAGAARPSGYPPMRRLHHGIRMLVAALRLRWQFRHRAKRRGSLANAR